MASAISEEVKDGHSFLSWRMCPAEGYKSLWGQGQCLTKREQQTICCWEIEGGTNDSFMTLKKSQGFAQISKEADELLLFEEDLQSAHNENQSEVWEQHRLLIPSHPSAVLHVSDLADEAGLQRDLMSSLTNDC